MKLFDSHCHLDDVAYDRDRQKIIDRAAAAGVVKMMIVGIDPARSTQAIRLAEAYPNCYASVGLHPHNAKHGDESRLKAMVQLAEHPGVCAWGEIGLDFNRMISPRADQERWFVHQLELATDLALPLIFHERDSRGRFLELLTAHLPAHAAGVVHCFSGTRDELERYLELGLSIGITGIVTMSERGAGLRRMIPLIPADRLLIETDAPYLTPAPYKNRTRRNEPAFVKAVLMALADILRQDPETLAAQIWENTCKLYKIED